MSIIKNLLSDPAFIEDVKSKVCQRAIGRLASSCHDMGNVEGQVTDFTIESDLNFGAPEGGALNWNVSFEAQGQSDVGFTLPSGDYVTHTVDGPCEGFVSIALPEDTVNRSDLDSLAEDSDVEVTLESLTIDLEEPDDGLDIDEDPIG